MLLTKWPSKLEKRPNLGLLFRKVPQNDFIGSFRKVTILLFGKTQPLRHTPEKLEEQVQSQSSTPSISGTGTQIV